MHSSNIRSHDRKVLSGPPNAVKNNARWQVLLGIGLISLLIGAIYWPALHGRFILDDELLTQNKLIKAPDGLYRFWCTTEPTDYWPVTSTSFWLEWRLWGNQPTGYHATNLVLHIADSLLLWLLLRQLNIPGAFLAALIFAVHPVNVESVAWIAQRKNLLALLFLFLSTFCYFKTDPPLTSENEIRVQQSAGPWYLFSLMLFVLAMLSKGSVVILPGLLLLITWWRRPLTIWDIARTTPFILVGGLLALLNVWFQTHGTGTIVRNVSAVDRLLGAGAVVWFYLFKALAPINLIFVYPQWNIQVGNFLWWLPLLAALTVTALLVWQCGFVNPKSRIAFRPSLARPLLFAWLFFCISLVPVMGFADVGYMQYSLVADHYQQIAIIGLIALIAAGISYWRSSNDANRVFAINLLAAVYVGGLTLLSFQQAEEYRDPVTLYESTLAKNPTCWLAHNNLGSMANDAGHQLAGIDHFNASLLLKPDQPKVYSNLGAALVDNGQLQQGIDSFQQALKLDPSFADAEFNWGVALRKAHRLPEAIQHLQRAVDLNQESAPHYNNLGQVLMETGQLDAALKNLKIACQLDPDDVNACAALAVAFEHAGRTDDAIATAQTGTELARSQHQMSTADQLERWIAALKARRVQSDTNGAR